MRIGCCGATVAGRKPEEADKAITGIEALKAIERLGFDYIELSLSDIMGLSEQAFHEQVDRLARSTVKAEAFHNFIPPWIRLTGPEAEHSKALDYAERAFTRVALLGGRIVVLGSAGARNVPQGFPTTEAVGQLSRLLTRMGELGRARGIIIAIEHLNKRESNIINSLSEALALVRQVGHENVRVLCDYYHFMLESENLDAINEAGPLIAHVHFAEVQGRGYPKEQKEGYRRFFERLREVGYDDRVSLEAFTKSFETDGGPALRVLRAIL